MDPAIWTDEYLDKMRLKGDEEADNAVHYLYDDVLDTPEAFRRINGLLCQLTFEGQLDVAKLPGPVRVFAEDSARLPDWCDPELVREGQQLFYANGFVATTLLLCASLPECYVMRNGVQVLGLTAYLSKRPKMRILETAQMVGDVMTPRSLVPDGKGVLAAQKVRLLHAAVRHLILEASGIEHHDDDMVCRYAKVNWDVRWGHPICQEDMAYTLQTFSYVVVRGLIDLGVKMTPRQREAYIHCWNVTGHIMGIERKLLPEPEPGDQHTRWELAEALYRTIRRRQEGRTKPGMALAGALVGFMQEVIDTEVEKSWILKHLGARKLRQIPPFLMLHLLGQPTLAYLGVELPNTTRFERFLLRAALRLTKWAENRYQRLLAHFAFRRASIRFHKLITEHLSALPPDHKQQFLPEHVRRVVEATGQRPSAVVSADIEPERERPGESSGKARRERDRPRPARQPEKDN